MLLVTRHLVSNSTDILHLPTRPVWLQSLCNFTLRDPVTNEQVPVSLSEQELARSLQYSGSKGIPDLLDWLIGLQEFSHGRKRGEGWDLTFGTGSSDLIYKVA